MGLVRWGRGGRRNGFARLAWLALGLFTACDGRSEGETTKPEESTWLAPERAQAERADPEPDQASAETARSLSEATPERPLAPPRVPNDLGSTHNNPPRAAKPQPAKLQVPDGFRIALYTDAVPFARSLARGSRGHLFVSTRKSDRIYAVLDRDGDGAVDEVRRVAEGLDTPNGLAFHEGTLYIAEVSRLWKIDDVEAKLDAPPKPTLVRDDFPRETHHGWRYLRFGPDGLLYMGVGAPCNLCERESPFASIVRMPASGGPLEVFASGVRNTVGFDFHPATGELWFTDNGRDMLGDDLPPGELNHAPRRGLHFGFPYCHAGVIRDPEFGEGHPCKDYRPPARALGAHVAPLGMRFYTGEMFPSRFRGAVLLAEHGSWNRTKRAGYRVMTVRIEGSKAASYDPLVTGFLATSGETIRGRPVDLEVLHDGSVVISDDYTGALYRLTYDAAR